MNFPEILGTVAATLGIYSWLKNNGVFYRVRRFAEYPELETSTPVVHAVLYVGQICLTAGVSAFIGVTLLGIAAWVALESPTTANPILRLLTGIECVGGAALFLSSTVLASNALQKTYRKWFPVSMLDDQLRRRGFEPPTDLRGRR